MKKRVIKLIVAVLCLMAFCLPFVAYAEDVPDVDVTTTTPDETTPSEDVTDPSEDVVVPPVEEDATVPEEEPSEDVTAEETPAEDLTSELSPEDDGNFSWEEVKETISSTIVVWIQEHGEEIGVIVTLIGYGIALFKKFKTTNKSMTTMNNNAIAMAKESAAFMKKAMDSIEAAANIVAEYKEKMDKLLESYEGSEEARKKLETELLATKEYLRVDSMANLEFANMFEELLALANIPNYKKQEMGERHLARVAEIKTAIEHAEHVTDEMVNVGEVKENVTEEA